ncbi:histone-lysine N-methyltransferase [Gordonibacter sp. An230]|uniref:histone-lysine N-methyltransferase n=1 Tax=Gordonibacter sp. An230 TaxID=1965592 RepID=UPI000B3868D1|nr:histone-lysine N-methyltransferase [Gordonibacter sp. An230]OUO90893.1 histone-lysine N-methyltransferase [Gordonibacter sp. An230]
MPKHAANAPRGASPESSPESPSDERIGLTEAFAPVGAERPGHSDEEGRIGLTEAFAPVGGAHAEGFSYRGDNEGEYPDALESLEPAPEPSLLYDDGASAASAGEKRGRHGKRQGASKQPLPPHLRKSRRMRRILIAVVVLLVLLIGALGYLTWRLLGESQTLATQQAQQQQSSQEVDAMHEEDTKDAATATTKKTEVPNLAGVLGLTRDEAVEKLRHGATVTSEKEVSEEGSAVKTNVTIALTDEPADTRSGTPTVYLGLDEGGRTIQAGYSAATASLGYGSLSFVDAVENEGIVEKTLEEAGVSVPAGSAVLPEDKAAYSTYASDGTTLVEEKCSFSGTVELDGVAHEWSSVLLYNYATANTSGNLADTIRMIYVYVNA